MFKLMIVLFAVATAHPDKPFPALQIGANQSFADKATCLKTAQSFLVPFVPQFNQRLAKLGVPLHVVGAKVNCGVDLSKDNPA